ncbi:hypothetical protein [Burkholderia sp. BCC1640]|uniref:hypothetical protein n=1 Tax=Burkholderia sp. BCC1640 TaxID=2676294 RepID=UPI00158AE32B|nr:hypothetical protein [Burkholderia sp. BCC1640]
MPDGVGAISAAVIAASGTLLVAYASNFLAEQYRRHLDSTSWAAALAGELESHAKAFPLLKDGFRGMLQLIDENKALPLYNIPTPTDPIFDSAPAKVGSLGPELAGEVAYAYEQLRAFRIALAVLTEHHTAMDDDQRKRRLTYLLSVIESNEQRLSALIQGLYAYANVPFASTPAMGWWRKLRHIAKHRN